MTDYEVKCEFCGSTAGFTHGKCMTCGLDAVNPDDTPDMSMELSKALEAEPLPSDFKPTEITTYSERGAHTKKLKSAPERDTSVAEFNGIDSDQDSGRKGVYTEILRRGTVEDGYKLHTAENLLQEGAVILAKIADIAAATQTLTIKELNEIKAYLTKLHDHGYFK